MRRAVRDLAGALGLDLAVAHVQGDDLLDRVGDLDLRHLDTGEPLGDRTAVTANAYLGAWGIAAALDAGAQVVVTGRVTDASLVVGPVASQFGWARDDWDRLAGAVVVGHVLECGTQATGGNYSFVAEEVARPVHPGFPLAEVFEDGTALVTKHPGTGGAVTVGHRDRPALYEIGGPLYAGPDVVTDFSTVALERVGSDLVRVSGARGHAPSGRLKVAASLVGGYRNRMEFVLTGLDVEGKAALALAGLADAYAGPFTSTLVRLDRPDAPTQEQAAALLRVDVRADAPGPVGRAFSSAAVELALASYPGCTLTGAPGDAQAYGVSWPGLVDAAEVDHVVVHADGRHERVAHTPPGGARPAPSGCPRAARCPPARPAGCRSGTCSAPGPGTRPATPTSASGRGPTRRRLARRLADRGGVPGAAAGGRRARRAGAPAAQPARGQRRRGRAARRGRGGQHPVRPAGQGARGVPPVAPGRPAGQPAGMTGAASSTWDVAVVGTGPAGAAAARAAATAGASVLLLDRAELPRYKRCGGGLIGASQAAVRATGVDLDALSRDAVGRVTFTSAGRRRFTREAPPFLPMVLRSELDAALVDAAVGAGAELRTGVTVSSYAQDGDAVTLGTSDGPAAGPGGRRRGRLAGPRRGARRRGLRAGRPRHGGRAADAGRLATGTGTCCSTGGRCRGRTAGCSRRATRSRSG